LVHLLSLNSKSFSDIKVWSVIFISIYFTVVFPEFEK
jgi:hypothetical protein